MKKACSVIIAVLLMTLSLVSCQLQTSEPVHGEHQLTHGTPFTHGHSIEIENEPSVAQSLEFLPVMAQTAKAARINELTVTVTNLSLMVSSATHLTKGDTYVIHFALATEEGEALIPIVPQTSTEKAYEGTSTFSAVQSTSFTLPEVGAGEYTLLAYVASADGTRVSEYAPLVFTEIVEFEVQKGDIVFKTVKSEGNNLILVARQPHDEEI